jgi:hypothetical protein
MSNIFNSFVRGFGHTMGSHAAKQIIKGNIDHSWRFMGLSTRRQWYICIVWVVSMIWSLRGMVKDYYGLKVDQNFWGMAFAISFFVVPVVMIVIQKILQGMEVRRARKFLENYEG